MSAVGDVLNQLGQTVIPQVAAIVFPDAMTIKERTKTLENGSEKITLSDAYTDIPVSYEAASSSGSNKGKETIASALKSRGTYYLTFPTHQNGTRIEFDISKHYFVTDERGNEPEKTFKPVRLEDSAGVVNKVLCIYE